MAGDWIKMRIDLQSHPKVVRILSAMRPHDVQTITDKFRVIGGLHAVWSVFDTHSIDGVLYGYTPETLDHIIGWEGFSAAMQHVEWLCFDGKETLTLPEFTEHNGQSAKRRAEDQKRKKDSRQSVRNLSADNADKKRTREEKRREERAKACASPDGDTPASNDPIPYQAIVTAYNTTMANLAKVRELTTKRRTMIRSAWQASPQRRNLEFWRDAYFPECQDDAFLNGTGPYTSGHENWRPTFDYLMRPDVVTRVFERAMDRLERAQ